MQISTLETYLLEVGLLTNAFLLGGGISVMLLRVPNFKDAYVLTACFLWFNTNPSFMPWPMLCVLTPD